MTPREWSRLADETDAAYAAFQEWLHSVDSTGARTDIYEWAAKWDGDQRRSDILRWARDDYWHIRGKAYDEWVGKRRIIKNFPLCAPAGALMIKIVQTELEKIAKMQEASGELPGTVDYRVLDRWFARVLRLEEFNKKWEAAEKAATSGAAAGEVYDWMRLEPEELRQVERLMEKAKVGS